MAESVDIIMPILQKIQADAADLRRDVSGGFSRIELRLDRVEKRMESIDNTLTYALGLNARTKTEIDGRKRRLDLMEAEHRDS